MGLGGFRVWLGFLGSIEFWVWRRSIQAMMGFSLYFMPYRFHVDIILIFGCIADSAAVHPLIFHLESLLHQLTVDVIVPKT